MASAKPKLTIKRGMKNEGENQSSFFILHLINSFSVSFGSAEALLPPPFSFLPSTAPSPLQYNYP